MLAKLEKDFEGARIWNVFGGFGLYSETSLSGHFKWENAPIRRSRCKCCGRTLARGEPRISVEDYERLRKLNRYVMCHRFFCMYCGRKYMRDFKKQYEKAIKKARKEY